MDKLNTIKYKYFLIILKYTPIVIGFADFIKIILIGFNVNVHMLDVLSYSSISSLFFLYFSSYVFQFCIYHRMFLHYVLIATIYKTIDLYLNIPIIYNYIFTLLMTITFIFMIIALCKYLRLKKGGGHGRLL